MGLVALGAKSGSSRAAAAWAIVRAGMLVITVAQLGPFRTAAAWALMPAILPVMMVVRSGPSRAAAASEVRPAIVSVGMVVRSVTSAAAASELTPALGSEGGMRSSGCPWSLAATVIVSADSLGALTVLAPRPLACPNRAVQCDGVAQGHVMETWSVMRCDGVGVGV